ncbi:LINE-1 reverse transcriptase isogeny [Gossypium australe]|uniref:LINE-1 reverse transcriptase isogeny n=1 Tax=Gossypium australe TaxID=47621 RepID=A0A5B6VBK9_9ROSI|nr:LINE-1 reverse transcriptase isogeny [Gossypium australe]
MDCISTTSMQIIWNDDISDEFIPSRGIQQGCPLSPYIFVLCIERLVHLIHKGVDDRTLKPISLGRNDPTISHLFFADDLFLFAKADVAQEKMIKDVLNTFGSASGHKVNTYKTNVFFSKNTEPRVVAEICGVLGFNETIDLGSYLGMLLFHRRVTTNTFNFVIEKIVELGPLIKFCLNTELVDVSITLKEVTIANGIPVPSPLVEYDTLILKWSTNGSFTNVYSPTLNVAKEVWLKILIAVCVTVLKNQFYMFFGIVAK